VRILFLNHDPSLYGATRSLVDLTLGLKRFGVDSKVLSPFEGPVGQLLQSQGVEHEVFPFQRTMAPCPNRVVLTRLRRAASNLRSLSGIRAAARKWNPDVVYTNSSVISVGWLLAKSIGRPHVWHLREMGDLDYGLCHDFGLTLFRLLLRTSSAVITNSKAVRDHVCPTGIRGRVNVIYNGIAPRARFEQLLEGRQPTNSEKPNFIMAGAVIPGKGQIDAIQALAIVRAHVPDANLTILGWGPDAYVAECRALCKHLGIGQAVEFLGHVSDPFPYYAKACAVLVCSKAEAFGRVTAEAMAAGCPVVGRASGGTLELIEDGKTGLLFSGGSDQLAQCMLTLVRSHDRAAEISKCAWASARDRFSIENYARAVFEVLTDVTAAYPNDT
jgi:glycosyltransferase involved in cell wall biosynthesis